MNIIRSERGQSVLEAALVIPFVIITLFNALNIGYIWWQSLNLASAPRQAIEYSINGTTSYFQAAAPDYAAVETLINNNVTASMSSTMDCTGNVQCYTRVCTLDQGRTGNLSNCTTFGSGVATGIAAMQADPEAPRMALNQVDIIYTVNPLIPGAAFNIGHPTPMTIHKVVVMRAMP